MEAYENIGYLIGLALPVYYVVYWSFFIVIADKLAAKNKWLALIPGIKIYLLRKMSGREYKTGRSFILFLLCILAWVGALLVIAYYSGFLLFNLVFWSGIAAYLIYRGAMLASIALRLGDPAWKAFLYGIPLISFMLITIAAFSSRKTIHEQHRMQQHRRSTPIHQHAYGQIGQQVHQHPRQRYAQTYGPPAQAYEIKTCSFCGEVNPPEFGECQNCGKSLGASRSKGWV